MSEELDKVDDGEVADEEIVVNQADLQGFLLKIAVGGMLSTVFTIKRICQQNSILVFVSPSIRLPPSIIG